MSKRLLGFQEHFEGPPGMPTPTHVHCPHCGLEIPLELPDTPGDEIRIQCHNCGHWRITTKIRDRLYFSPWQDQSQEKYTGILT